MTINGYEHTYTYAQRFLQEGPYEQEKGDFNIGVKYGNKSDTQPYTRAVYKSDYNYINTQNSDNELKVYVTYELRMDNESSSLKTKVNSIIDYYDKEYTLVSAGTKPTENGSPNGDIAKWNEDNETLEGDGVIVDENVIEGQYKKVILPNKHTETVEEKGNQSIYVQFRLSRAQVANILQGKNEKDKADTDKLLNNVAEINSYSIYDDNGIYAGIDKDSNPGNSTPGQINTYEDDTDSAPALQLEVANAREMKGTVFIDNPDLNNKDLYGNKGNQLNASEIMSGYVRQGNGIYDTDEATVNNVTVELRDANTNQVVKVYKAEDPNNWTEAQVQTMGNGEFTITNYIPGDYVVTYTWGGQTYTLNNENKTITVQDYKGTIYPDPNRQNHTGTTRTNKKEDNDKDKERWWHVSIDSQTGNKNINETRYTDAKDNYEIRKKIDDQIKEVGKDTKNNVDKAYQEAGNIITQMESTTPKMEIGVEFSSYTDPSSGDSYKYCIHDIDFGIIERAKQDLVLTKRIKSMKVTLANGQVIADLEINDDGTVRKVSGEDKGVTYMQPQSSVEPKNGFIRLELDNELIQGTKLEVTYEIKATNNSELDYIPNPDKTDDTATFYTYGEVGNNVPITISPVGIVDYLDKNWSFDSKTYEDTWTVKKANEIEKDVIETVWNTETTETTKSSIAEKMILHTEKLKESKLVPNNAKNKGELQQSDQVDLSVSKILTTTDEISLENEAEEVKVTRDGGRTLETIPGNYIPGSGSTEADDSMAETAIVTPATGEDLNYILPIIIGTTALIILGVGIIIIKKKVL